MFFLFTGQNSLFPWIQRRFLRFLEKDLLKVGCGARIGGFSTGGTTALDGADHAALAPVRSRATARHMPDTYSRRAFVCRASSRRNACLPRRWTTISACKRVILSVKVAKFSPPNTHIWICTLPQDPGISRRIPAAGHHPLCPA